MRNYVCSKVGGDLLKSVQKRKKYIWEYLTIMKSFIASHKKSSMCEQNRGFVDF